MQKSSTESFRFNSPVTLEVELVFDLIASLNSKKINYSQFVQEFRALFQEFLTLNQGKDIRSLILEFESQIGIRFDSKFWEYVSNPDLPTLVYQSHMPLDCQLIRHAEDVNSSLNDISGVTVYSKGKLYSVIANLETKPL